MNIQNIQIAQSLFHTVEERLSSRKETGSSPEDAALPQVNLPDATVDKAQLSGERDLMQVVYPPFFPIGNTQDILFIEGVKQLTREENAKGDSSVASDEQKAIKQQENNKAANPDVREVKEKRPQVKHDVNPGVVLDLKI